MKQILMTLLLAASMLTSTVANASAQASGTQPSRAEFKASYYRLTFVLKEMEAGRTLNSRSYFMTIGTAEGSTNSFYTRSIRTGTKIPIAYEAGKISYVDVGVNIDCKNVIVRDAGLAMDLSAEVSSVIGDPGDVTKTHTMGGTQNPVIQQNRWNSEAVVVLNKPFVVFSSDEPTSKRSMQLEVTATEIK